MCVCIKAHRCAHCVFIQSYCFLHTHRGLFPYGVQILQRTKKAVALWVSSSGREMLRARAEASGYVSEAQSVSLISWLLKGTSELCQQGFLGELSRVQSFYSAELVLSSNVALKHRADTLSHFVPVSEILPSRESVHVRFYVLNCVKSTFVLDIRFKRRTRSLYFRTMSTTSATCFPHLHPLRSLCFLYFHLHSLCFILKKTRCNVYLWSTYAITVKVGNFLR